jgi:hypothetical protein
MNRKQLIIMLVLVALIGGAGVLLVNRQNESWKGTNASIGKKLLGDFPVNDVTHISFRQGTNQLNLAKTDIWRVRERNNYPADYKEISDFLIKLNDLKVVQTEKIGSSQLARLSLVPGEGTNSATVMELKDQKDKTIKSLVLGKKHMQKSKRPSPFGDMGDEGYAAGRYIQVSGESGSVSVISDPLQNTEPKAEQWLNKEFFKIEKPRSIAVTFPTATNSWKLSRETETGEWKLADAQAGEQLDSSKASSVANPLNSPSFSDVAISATPETIEKPTVATIETFENLTYTLKVGQKTNDNYPLALTVVGQLPKERTPGKDEKPEDKEKLDKEFKEKQKKLEDKVAQEKALEKWVYLVSTWTVDPLLKERSTLMVEKKEEPKKDDKAATVVPDINKIADSIVPPISPTDIAKPEPPKPSAPEAGK